MPTAHKELLIGQIRDCSKLRYERKARGGFSPGILVKYARKRATASEIGTPVKNDTECSSP